ncbi:transporter substrate-binding domain-containing protein [Brucella sp. LJL56]
MKVTQCLKTVAKILGLSAATIVSVHTASATSADVVTSEIRQRGFWNVGTETNSPPMEFHDLKSGELTGFNVELVKALSKKMNLELKFQEMDVPSLIPALDSGRIDMLGSHISDVPSRQQKLSFVDYLKTGPVFYTLKDNVGTMKEEVDLCGKAIGVPEHTTYFKQLAQWSEKFCPADKQLVIIGTKGLPDTKLQIQQGRVFAGVIGAEKLPYWATDPKNMFVGIGKPLFEELYGFAFARSGTGMRNAVKAALEELLADGTYKTLLEQFGMGDQGLSTITIDEGKEVSF